MKQEQLLADIERLKKEKAAKKLNSKEKGDRGEYGLIKKLIKYFGPGFMKTPRSGGAVGGSNFNPNLRQDANEILSSDVITPIGFRFSLESKNWAEDAVRVRDFLSSKDYHINAWWKQCCEDAARAQKDPMLVVKLNQADPFAMIRYDSVIFKIQNEMHFKNTLVWFNEYSESLFIIELQQLLDHCDERFWGLPKII